MSRAPLPPKQTGPGALREDTEIVHSGLDPFQHFGFVNPPAYRGSTVLFPTLDKIESRDQPYTYGLAGTPTTAALETAICRLEGGVRTYLTNSGLSAITVPMLAFVRSGDHVLIPDNVYFPTRRFCDRMLKGLGVETTYYDPLLGAGITEQFRPNTRLVLTECPGSQTMEMQDVPAIAKAARARDIWVLMDNTWASPLYFKPFEHGVDVSIQAATKYICGHSDALLGSVTVNERARQAVEDSRQVLGVHPGSEETFLGLRGIRTISVRLKRHWHAAIEVARWLEARPEVHRVIHPALESHPGHALWKRDFLGASGLFSIVLKPTTRNQLAAFLDHLQLFGMGYSWGGFESLIIPFDPRSYRTTTAWNEPGPALRLHIGLEDLADIKVDLLAGFGRMAAAG